MWSSPWHPCENQTEQPLGSMEMEQQSCPIDRSPHPLQPLVFTAAAPNLFLGANWAHSRCAQLYPLPKFINHTRTVPSFAAASQCYSGHPQLQKPPTPRASQPWPSFNKLAPLAPLGRTCHRLTAWADSLFRAGIWGKMCQQLGVQTLSSAKHQWSLEEILEDKYSTAGGLNLVSCRFSLALNQSSK